MIKQSAIAASYSPWSEPLHRQPRLEPVHPGFARVPERWSSVVGPCQCLPIPKLQRPWIVPHPVPDCGLLGVVQVLYIVVVAIGALVKLPGIRMVATGSGDGGGAETHASTQTNTQRQ